jgi:hypothetical protein
MRVHQAEKEPGRQAPTYTPAELLVARLQLAQDILAQVLGTPLPQRRQPPREVRQAHALVQRALGGLRSPQRNVRSGG